MKRSTYYHIQYKINSVEEIDIKDHTYCFCNDMINTTNLDPIEIKIDEKRNKDILIYDASYVKQIV